MYSIRFIEPYPTYNPGILYLHQKDVVNYLMELAAGEETDTRERIEAAASILGGVCRKNAIRNSSSIRHKGKC